jgi:hypothetical protein
MMNTRSLSLGLFLAVSTAALACGSSHEPDTTTPPITKKAAKVDVAIESVTLADDCGGGPMIPPPALPEPEEKTASASMSQRKAAPSASMAGDVAMGARACEQSSIQLRVTNSSDAASKVTVQKVELLDASGTKVADLTPRAPSKWAADDYTYQTWNEEVAPNATLQVSYALNAPHVARGETYTVRVVIGAAGEEQTLETKTTLEFEASLPPGVVT